MKSIRAKEDRLIRSMAGLFDHGGFKHRRINGQLDIKGRRAMDSVLRQAEEIRRLQREEVVAPATTLETVKALKQRGDALSLSAAAIIEASGFKGAL